MSSNGPRGKTVLVFGVSGVGKTTACKEFVSKHPEYRYLSAGGVLEELKKLDPERLRMASKRAIIDNQYMLARELKYRMEAIGSSSILVDLHGVINNGKYFIEVPIDVISSLRPDVLVLLEAPASVILDRRKSDANRVRPILSIDHLYDEQVRERSTVTEYANSLCIPLLTSQVGPGFSLESLQF